MSVSDQTALIPACCAPKGECKPREKLRRMVAEWRDLGASKEHGEHFSAQYDDPTAQVVIRCSDLIHFRAHAWSLKKASGFFADLLDSTQTEPVLTKTPIELPAGYFAVKDFLEFAYTGRSGWEISTTFEEFKEGLDLANFLRVPVLEAAYLTILCQSKMTTSRPWDCFVLAAQKGNLHLARMSIKAFSTTGSDNPAVQLPFLTKEAEKVPLDWMQELMRRRIKQEPATDRTPGKRYSEVPWETVSQMFMSGKPVGDPVSKVSTPKSVKKK